MRYEEFKNSVIRLPVIFSRDVLLRCKDKQVVRNQLNRWVAKGLLIKLRRGIYILNENDRKIIASRGYIANQLYNPSYISLEYALGFYGLIPERVYDVTSITTKKTLNIKNSLGSFVYSHVKLRAYRGFHALNDESGFNFFLATPEKAILDFIYLNMKKFKKPYKKIFEESYRLQNIDILKPKRLKMLVPFYDSRKTREITHVLLAWIAEGE